MIFVIGGMAQGRLNFVFNKFGLDFKDVFDAEKKKITEFSGEKIIYHMEEAVSEWILSEKDYQDEVKNLINHHNDCIVISQEMGSGLVPIDEYERKWREISGRVNNILAENSIEVYRVCCGIGLKIKGREGR